MFSFSSRPSSSHGSGIGVLLLVENPDVEISVRSSNVLADEGIGTVCLLPILSLTTGTIRLTVLTKDGKIVVVYRSLPTDILTTLIVK